MKHCVASYIRRVAKGSTKILFIRTTDNERVATMEVNRGRIVQVRGKRNEEPGNDVMDFVKEWSLEKGIIFRGVNQD